MALIEWNESLSVGVKVIDEQHKKLLGHMNELYDALEQKKENEILLKVFADLDDYIKKHFCFEEECFANFDYKNKDSHIPQHCVFRKKIADMKKSILSGNQDAEDLLEFLSEWIKNHIKKSDKEYRSCFNENGMN